MSEEEKKAIEYLKQNSIPILRYDNFGNILSPLYYGTFEKETILNLIEKQQNKIASQEKEIKLMKSININDNYINKDKIRNLFDIAINEFIDKEGLIVKILKQLRQELLEE